MTPSTHTLRVFLLDGQTASQSPYDEAARWARRFGENFDRMFRAGMTRGCMGTSVPFDYGREITADWLALGDWNCFATFIHPDSPEPDYLLVLSRKDPRSDRRQLQWFVDRVLKPIGAEPEELVQRGIRICDRPSVLVVRPVAQGSRNDALLDVVETSFAQSFLRCIDEGLPAPSGPSFTISAVGMCQ